MTTAAIHIPARYYRPEPARDYTAPFERWLGYSLHPAIRHVFTHLERQRAKRQPQRLFIRANPDVDTLLRTALADYLRWRLDVTDPLETCVVYARDRKGLTQFSHPRSLLYTSFNPEGPRGLNLRMALVLDADSYPDPGRHFGRVWRTVAPPMDFTRHSLLIVHGTPRPRKRVNTFTLRYKALLRDHTIPLIDLTLSPPPPAPLPSDNRLNTDAIVGARYIAHAPQDHSTATQNKTIRPPSHLPPPTSAFLS